MSKEITEPRIRRTITTWTQRNFRFFQISSQIDPNFLQGRNHWSKCSIRCENDLHWKVERHVHWRGTPNVIRDVWKEICLRTSSFSQTLTRPHGWQQQPPSASIPLCVQDAILAEFVFTVPGKKQKKMTMDDAERTTSSSSRETANELVPGEDFWWDSNVRQRRRHHRPGVSLADRPLDSQLFRLSLSECSLPLLFFLHENSSLATYVHGTRPLPLSSPLPPSLSRAYSLTCSLSRFHVVARDISVSLCCTPTTGLDLMAHGRITIRARSQWAQRLEPIFDLHEGLCKVYTRGTDYSHRFKCLWIDDTVGKGQLALSHEGRLSAGASCYI